MSPALFSRDEEEIRECFQHQFDQVEIAAHSDDISLYVGVELSKRIEEGRLRISDTALKDEILSRLITGAQGMFRWVACQLDALGECVTDAERRLALYEMPRTLPQTYERILDRVNQKRHSVQRLVRLSLHFISLEKTEFQLPIAQLCQVVSIPEQPGTNFDDLSVVKEQEIARACSSFIRKSADGLYFEFAHFSVREYLEDSSLLEKPDLRPYNICDSITGDSIACQYLRVLLLKNFDRKPCRHIGEQCDFCLEKKNLQSLYQSAATSWPLIVRYLHADNSQSSAELLELQKSILHPEKSNQYLNWAIELCDYLRPDDMDMEYTFHLVLDSGLTPLHIALALDLVEVGTWLLGLDVPIPPKNELGSLLEFSVAGAFALVGDITENRSETLRKYMKAPRSSSLADELSSRGETLSNPSEAFSDRKLMRLACESVVLGSNFLMLKILLDNGWKLCPEDVSIARHQWKTEDVSVYDAEEDSFLDFVKYLNALQIHKTIDGHELCALIWNMAISDGQSFVTDTSLLPSSITLSHKALIERAIRSIIDDEVEDLRVCEQDSRFNIHDVINEDGEYCLHVAAEYGSWRALDYMVDAGFEVENTDSCGWNFLHNFAYWGPIEDSERFPQDLEMTLGKLDTKLSQLFCAVTHKGENVLDIAFREGNKRTTILLLKHHPQQLGCCYGRACIWDLAARANSKEAVRTLVDIKFPRHLPCSDGRPFHSLHHYTDLETFNLLHALYPESLQNYMNGKLPLESCLRRWVDWKGLRLEHMDVNVIQALLRYSVPLSPTSSETVFFCCRLVSSLSPPGLESRFKLLLPFLERGIDVHHEFGRTSILESACQSFTTETVTDSKFAIKVMKAILDRADKEKLNRLNAAGNSILHTVCASTTIDTDWLIPELVERGADVNKYSGPVNSHTALVASINIPLEQSTSSAQTLLKLGADPALAIPNGWDAAQTASLRGVETFLRILLQHLTTTSTAFDWKRRCAVSHLLADSKLILQGMNSLHMASIAGHKDCFDFFLDNNLLKDVHATSGAGYTCLHLASLDHEAQMIDYLIDLGLDIDQPAADGSTPLHMAVRKDSRLGVEKLLNRGSSMKTDVHGMTPMMYARKLSLVRIIKLLESYDTPHVEVESLNVLSQASQDKYWRRALEKAILESDVQLCRQILGEGCPVDVSLPRCGGCSPLIRSMSLRSPDSLELVSLFLNRSASVCKQACSKHGSKPALIKALQHPHLNCFLPRMLDLCLQERSENVSRDMLVESLKCGNTEALTIMINHIRENESDYARFFGHVPDSVISRVINDYGHDLPLHQAVIEDNLDAVIQLLEAGADINALDHCRTPLKYCKSLGSISDYLLSQGATVTSPPWSPWLHSLGGSVRTQKEMAAQILRLAPIEMIYGPFPQRPELQPKVLLFTINSGQDLNAKDGNNCSIMFAAMHSSGTAPLVLNTPLRLKKTDPVQWHMYGGPIEDASCLNQHWKHYCRRFGMDELRRVSNLQPNRGWSPLCLATYTDAIGVMKNCLEMGAEIDFEGSPYGSALMAAAGMNRIESVKFLVRHNASIFYTGKHGFTSAVMVGNTSQGVVDWLLVARFQDQGKLEATSDSSPMIDNSSNSRPRLSWCPTRIQLRLNADFERRPHESLFAYLQRLAHIKERMRGRIVPVPKPEFIARTKVSAVYDI